ncbi:CsbD family protein [Cyanobium sp. Candia 9D4]|uniref:CsbD family protein n=1 Tax=Cyanobium sp. Candia 9D4 TaxID=2823707 RepID=UPI0028F3E79D|nr:CsbD family protein [Cyanobium sp. Candia 9D4]
MTHQLPQFIPIHSRFPLSILAMNRHIRLLRQLAATGLGLVISLLMLIATPALSASAQASGVTLLSASTVPLAAAAGRFKAGTKDMEGKTQESIGKVTGSKGDRLAGKAKQAEAKGRNAVETVKDKAGMG